MFVALCVKKGLSNAPFQCNLSSKLCIHPTLLFYSRDQKFAFIICDSGLEYQHDTNRIPTEHRQSINRVPRGPAAATH